MAEYKIFVVFRGKGRHDSVQLCSITCIRITSKVQLHLRSRKLLLYAVEEGDYCVCLHHRLAQYEVTALQCQFKAAFNLA